MAFGPLFQNGFMPTIQNNSDALLQTGLGLLSGSNPQQQAAYAAQGFAGVRQKNKTAATLRAAGYNDLADGVENGSLSGNDAFKLFYGQKLEAQNAKKNYISAGGSIYNPSTGEWITPPANPNSPDNQESFFGNPIAIQGPNPGDPITYGQIGNRGHFKPIEIGNGNRFAPPVKMFDTGTSGVPVGPGGVPVGQTIPKDVAGRSNQEALGTAQAAAQTQLLQQKQVADDVATNVAAIKADPAESSVLGVVGANTPNIFPAARRVQARIDQLKGEAFLNARQMLKGGGAITDFEGRKAEAAKLRMDQAQNQADFNAALDDFNDAVQEGYKKLQAQAAGNFNPDSGGAAPPPAAGGGNPTVRKYNPATGKIE